MPNPMTIHEAHQLSAGDLEIGEQHVAQAERDADGAEQAAAQLADRAIEGGKGAPEASAVVDAHAQAELTRQRAVRVREKADRAAAAQRLLALEAVGKDVEQIHASVATPSASMAAALKMISDGAAALRELVGAHNRAVSSVIARAKALDVEQPAPSGPRTSSAHVAVTARQASSGFTTVRQVDDRTVGSAIELAVKGDAEGAVTQLHAAHRAEPPKRADHYYFSNGRVFAQDDGTRRDGSSYNIWPAKIAKGEARELNEDEVAAYLDGRFDSHQAQA